MEPEYIRPRMEEEILTNVTVTDVYDQAAGIGKEFEKLIETYGVEAVTDLMPKVIKSLEQLEALAGRYEKESSEIHDLKYAIDKLESEKVEKAQDRARFEEELIQIEDSWQKESKELLAMIGKLQDENRRLKDNLQDTKQAVVDEVAAVTKRTEDKEIEVLTKLKETVDRQREEIRKAKREVSQKNVDCEALQTQLERVVKVNTELRRRNQTHRKHTRNLIEEKSQLETQLAEKEQQVLKVRETLSKEDSTEEEPVNKVEKSRLQQIEEDIETDHVQHSEDGGHLGEGDVPHMGEGENMGDVMDKDFSLVGKMVVDMKDPNRPRFTLNELRTVLMERNELKAQLIEVEEELEAYRPPRPDNTVNNACLADELAELEALEAEDDLSYSGEDLPVQGPINKEPYDKLYPDKKVSGIRKFFSFVFGSSPKSKPSPRPQRRSSVE